MCCCNKYNWKHKRGKLDTLSGWVSLERRQTILSHSHLAQPISETLLFKMFCRREHALIVGLSSKFVLIIFQSEADGGRWDGNITRPEQWQYLIGFPFRRLLALMNQVVVYLDDGHSNEVNLTGRIILAATFHIFHWIEQSSGGIISY